MRGLFRLGLALTLVTSLLSGCDKSTPPEATKAEATAAAQQPTKAEEIPPSWDAHIAEYPRGWIAAQAPLFIRFTHPVVSADQVNTAFDPKQLSSDIKIPLNLVFTSTTELRITPAERLPNDRTIHFSLRAKNLDGIENTLDDFAFDVHTIKQDFDLQVNGLIALDTDDTLMQLTGNLVTDDTAALDDIKTLLRVKANGQKLDIVWSQESDEKTNHFTINNIARATEAGQLHIEWDGTALGSSEKGARDIDIPAIAAFTITGTRVIHRPETFIELQFSDELDKRQNLRGLISLNGRTDLKTEVDASSLKIYPRTIESGELELIINRSVKNAKGRLLLEDYHHRLVLNLTKPSVNFVGSTSILPPAAQISVPFEAAGVDSVQIIAFKVFANNMGQYLQDNELTSAYARSDTGRYLWRKIYRLPEVPKDGKKRFNLDLTELMAQHPDGLMRLELRIDRSNSIYTCEQPRPTEPVRPMPANAEGQNYSERYQTPEWYQSYYESSGYYNYSERNNPCSDTYYSYGSEVTSARNFIVSNIGLMAKRGEGHQLNVIATELDSAKPLAGAQVTAYNYQQQPIGMGYTDVYGMLVLDTDGVPYYLQATAGKQIGYLRMRNSEALPTNQFDVSGDEIRGGLKGALYGERDVWRPGDEIFLTFVLEDKAEKLPAKHPVVIDLFDPRGKKVASQTNVQPVNNFYTFTLATDETAPTGNYRAVVHVGNRFFDKILKIETIVPNRIKVELTPAETPFRIGSMPTQVELFAQWLQGATAKNLKADSELKLSSRKTQFAGFKQFVFDDLVRVFSGSTQKPFDGKLDEQGKASFAVNVSLASPPPGMLTAQFMTRVFEESGNFSTIIRPFELRPFDAWVGLNIPKGEGYMDAISRDKDHPVLVQTLDDKGAALAGRHVEVNVYEIGWRWWWDEEDDNIAEYFNNSHYRSVATENLVTDEFGRANWQLEKRKYRWGRHLVRVCDTDGGGAEKGHCASQIVYLGWSWDQSLKADSATQLMLSTDKNNYAVGEVAKVRLPNAREGRVLLSLENGSRVLQTRWLDLAKGQTDIEIPVTEDMAPNVYVNITLLLPHQERVAEAPMRLYGIVPLLVENPQTRLTPQLDVPEKVRPESEFTIKVNEKTGRAMTYSLAIVDEGLLGLTNFHAPDLHDSFYQREALGVRTWDLFDQVVGAYGASLERVLAIGGSDSAQDADRKRRERRFPPVVKFLGAFSLNAGETREHTVKLPPYMGAVRVMLVAGDSGETTTAGALVSATISAYGTTEKTVTVTQPVTLFATLPRVLGPGEEVNLPVNVFVSDAAITDVDISVEANDIFTIEKGADQLHFSEPGDAISSLKLKVNDRIGKGRVKVTARSGNEFAEQEIFIDSRSPNSPTTVWKSKILQPGEVWTSPLAANGMFGTNQASVEISSMPPLNLDKRLKYLIQYPHGCVEQTTSSVFPQLHLNQLMDLSPAQKTEIDSNIAAGIKRLEQFQHASGGFTYWPGDSYVNEWASNYAGHFIVEAKRAGYKVPNALLDNWVKYQRSAARAAQVNGNYYDESVLAYRLYTLALADKAELSAMNRLREEFKASSNAEILRYRPTARWMLALAYQHLGLKDAAQDVLGPVIDGQVPDYDDWGYTYGSGLRDRAILLSALTALEVHSDIAWQVASQQAESLSSEGWYSTQSVAWALLSMSEFAQKNGSASNSLKFALQEEGQSEWQAKSAAQIFYQQAIANPHISVRNDNDKPLRVLVSNRGIPANMHEEPGHNGLSINVNFMTMDNKPLNVEKLPQGTDFVAEVTVSADLEHMLNRRIEDIALTAVVPSGWQIRNERLEGAEMPKGIDYMDIRDDRTLAYFSLWRDYYWYYRYQDRNRTSVTLRIILNASYAGKFYMPGWLTAAMYDEKLFAKTKGYWVEVVAK